MNKENFIWAVSLNGSEMEDHHKEHIKTEYDLKDEDIKSLKVANLFRIVDNIKYWQFDSDIVLLDEESESYYHTGDSEVMNKVENKEIVALIDENSELEMV